MADSSSGNTAPSRPKSGPTLVFIALLLFIIALFGGTLFGVEAPAVFSAAEPDASRVTLMWVWASAILLVAFIAVIMMIVGSVRWALFGAGVPKLQSGDAVSNELMKSINDRLLISDQAKRIAYREQDRDALRKAIREDIDKGDFEAALVLAYEMGDSFGYREEAEQFREEILAAREAYVERKVNDAIAGLDQMLAQHQWHRALLEAGKIQRLYHDSPKVSGLENYVRESFQKYKESLVKRFSDAYQREDIEQSMELLKELDRYLTQAESAPYREMARDVIARKREALSAQFRMAVQEKDWGAALRIGQMIMDQFPNSKMANEVKGKLNDLRMLAQQQTAQAT